MMFLQVLSFSWLLDKAFSKLALIADFGSLFMIGIGLLLLGLAIVTAIYDTWWTPRRAQKSHSGILSRQPSVQQPLDREGTQQGSADQEQVAFCCASRCL